MTPRRRPLLARAWPYLALAVLAAGCIKPDPTDAQLPAGAPIAVDTGVAVVTATVSTLAGGTLGYADGPAAAARFNRPRGIAVDAQGAAYVIEDGRSSIRKIAPDGTVSTLAGTAEARTRDGGPADARFDRPRCIAVDRDGNLLVFQDGGPALRRVTPTGQVTTLPAVAPAGTGRPLGVTSIAVAGDGRVYLADWNHACVWKHDGGLVRFADLAQIGAPYGLAAGGERLLVTSVGFSTSTYGDQAFRIVGLDAAGAPAVLAGGASEGGYGGTMRVDGSGDAARFAYPAGLAVDGAGNVYVADFLSNAIRVVSKDGMVRTLAGGARGALDGPGAAATFDAPIAVARTPVGDLLVADYENHRIRKIVLGGGK